MGRIAKTRVVLLGFLTLVAWAQGVPAAGAGHPTEKAEAPPETAAVAGDKVNQLLTVLSGELPLKAPRGT